MEQPGLCGRCHAPEGRPAEVAGRIGTALDRAAAQVEDARERVRSARRRGMLMIDAQAKLQEAHQHVIQARTVMHTVDPARVEAETGAAQRAATAASDLAREAFAEIRYRRTGLLVATLLIAFAVAVVLAKIRQLDRARGER
jgi:hypothetical protein